MVPRTLHYINFESKDHPTINDVSADGRTPLMHAVCQGKPKLVDLLIKHNAQLDLQDKEGSTAIHLAVKNNKESCLRELLKTPAKKNVTDFSGNSALILAVLSKQTNMLDLLLEEKVDPDIQNKSGQTALMLAINRGLREQVIRLIKAGANLDLIDKASISGLAKAILSGNLELVNMLIEHKVKIDNPFMLQYFLEQQNRTDPRVIACQNILKSQCLREAKSLPKEKVSDKEHTIVPFMLDCSSEFERLSADKKIELLAKRIEEVCCILKEKKPQATWIIVWREYGIEDVTTCSIADSSRIKLKDTMLSISEKYPNLIIIAGSTLTRKPKKVKDLPKILGYYDKLDRLEKIENYSKVPEDHQISLHKNQIKNLLTGDPEKEVTVTANKARIYYRGKEYKHGKTTPFLENHGLKDQGLVVTQPGKENNLSPIIRLSKDLVFAVSICREICPAFALVKQSEEENPGSGKVLLHFIISKTIHLPLSAIHAKYAAIHIDNRYDPKCILTREHKRTNLNLEIYPVNVLKIIKELGISMEPSYPVQFQILDKIEESENLANIKQLQELDYIFGQTLVFLPQYRITEFEYSRYEKFLEKRKQVLGEDFINGLIAILDSAPNQLNFVLKKNSTKPEKSSCYTRLAAFFQRVSHAFDSVTSDPTEELRRRYEA